MALHVTIILQTTYQQLDSLLSIYLNEMYSLGTGKAAANSTVFGLNIIQPAGIK